MRGLASVHTQSVFQADRPTPGLTPQQPSVRQAVYHHIKGLGGDGDKHHHRLHASTVADAAAERRRRVRWRRTSAGRPGRARVNPAAFRVAGREGRPATQARCCLGEGGRRGPGRRGRGGLVRGRLGVGGAPLLGGIPLGTGAAASVPMKGMAEAVAGPA